MDYLISMYIDNELSLEEKIVFVEHVSEDRRFAGEAVSFLKQEKALRSALPEKMPEVSLPFPVRARFALGSPRTLGLAFAASLLILAALFFKYTPGPPPPTALHPAAAVHQHRFVIYQTGTRQIEIAGSFTNWQRIPLQPHGTTGYWEITLEVPPGEHAFSYILDGDRIVADPTVPAQEKDDFGAVNSILVVEPS